MRRAPIIALWCVAVLGACTSDAATPTSSSVVTADTGVADGDAGEVEVVDDEPELVIGALLPLTGPGAELGSSMRDAVMFAVDEVDAAGGVGGLPVDLQVEDEGADATSAAGALEALLAKGVDAIIGPASSVGAATVLPVTTRAGVLTCSPTASALSLDEFPDDGLFVRTIPSDSLQAEAIAQYVLQTGAGTAAVLYLDDVYGRPFAETVASELSLLALDVKAFVPYDPAVLEYADTVRVATATAAQVVVVIGDSSAGPRVVSALFDTAGPDTQVVINDAMRVPATASAYQRLSAEALTRLSGVSPTSRIVDQTFAAQFRASYPDSSELFAANAYDCVSVIALAATAAGSAAAHDMALQLPTVTHLGGPCATYTSCVTGLVDGRNIDYNGPSGELHIDTNGEVATGRFEVFHFDAEGQDMTDDGQPLLVDR